MTEDERDRYVPLIGEVRRTLERKLGVKMLHTGLSEWDDGEITFSFSFTPRLKKTIKASVS